VLWLFQLPVPTGLVNIIQPLQSPPPHARAPVLFLFLLIDRMNELKRRKFFKWSTRFVVQYLVVDVTLNAAAFVMTGLGVFGEGQFSPSQGYMWVTIAEGLSLSLCIWAMLVFYHVLHDDLKPIKPLPKFICVKAIVILAFVQRVVVAILIRSNAIKGNSYFTQEEMSIGIQDWLICVETVVIAIAAILIFSYRPYIFKEKRSLGEQLSGFFLALLNVVFLWDMIRETFIALNPCSSDNTTRHEKEMADFSDRNGHSNGNGSV